MEVQSSSLNQTAREFMYGCIGGFIGQTLCHPFDTIKTRLQRENHYGLLSDLRKRGFSTLYNGLPSPLLSVIIEKSLLFSSYDIMRSSTQVNPFVAGLAAGVITTLSVTPFERVKIRCQISRKGTFTVLREILRRDGIMSLYRGWSATMVREVPGYGLYFYTYENVKKKFGGELTPIQSFLTGSSCGVAAWLVIYPSDPVKTIMQNDNVNVRTAVKEIYTRYGVLGFYRGFSWALARAAILHGGVFLGYETAKKFHNNSRMMSY
jgi:solute carrier family 25 carnitine/acylcarnitine transporter 20/29